MSRPQDLRPLSPHLSVYRWQVSNTLSILHRVTGFGLSFGLIVFAAWLWTAAYSPEYYTLLQELAASIVGKLFLFAWTVAFYYHFGNGIRHLNWDMGRGFSIPEMTRSGIVVLVFAASMSVLTWVIVLKKAGL